MCFDEDSVPPVPANADVPAVGDYHELTAADGNRFAAYTAVPREDSGVAVVVLPDTRGLYDFYIELAHRLAENGHTALVFDYYGRTAGVGRRDKGFAFAEHMVKLTPKGLHTDLTAAIAHVRSADGGSARAVVTMGFCLGGRLAVMAAAGGHDLAGVVGFYCWPAPGPGGAPGPTAAAGRFEAPVLALMAGDDPDIPRSDVDAFEAALTAAGVDHEVVTYDGAPHSFFDAKRGAFAEQSLDAWRRVLEFVERVTARVPAES